MCSGIHVLDMQRMMPCNDSVGTCVENNVWLSLRPWLWLSGFFSHPGRASLCLRLPGASASLGTNFLPVRLRRPAISGCF